MIIDHIGIAVSNYARSKAFFSQALAPLGIELIMEVEGWAGLGRGGKPELWFGEAAGSQSPMHMAFTAESRAQVDGFYKAALAAGGKDNGPPGIRAHYHPNYYGAFVIGPDGHNVEAVCHKPDAAQPNVQSNDQSAAPGAPGATPSAFPPGSTPSDVYPSLTYDDAAAAIEWLCRAFGFTKRFAVPGEGNRIEHSELTHGTGVVMIGSPKTEDHRKSPRSLDGVAQALSVYVADPDAHYVVAMAAGAKLVRELRTEEYGARGYMVLDPEGHLWYFGNYRPGGFWQTA
jgi:uncharacterized glyoxalase superfamily protein PhnB